MSFIGDLAFNDQRMLEEDALANPATTLPEPGFWDGSGTALFSGIGQGLAQLTLQAAQYGNDPTQMISLNVESDEDNLARREHIGDLRNELTERMRPDAVTSGAAAQILFGLGDAGSRFAFGLASGGMPVGALTAGTSMGEQRFTELKGQGVDTKTAAISGVIEGGVIGVGAFLPAARLFSAPVVDLAATAGANVGLGIAARGGVGAVLEKNGYKQQAQQYKALDATGIAVDALLGGLFWGAGRAMTRGVSAGDVDAALTANNGLHHQHGTAPGAPVDAPSSIAHQAALDQAISQLGRGEPVDVPQSVRDAQFLKTDTEESPLQSGVDAVRADLQAVESRRANDEFATRVGRDAEYDDAGAPVFRDGTAYPLAEVGRFFDQHVGRTQPKDGSKVPDVLFQIGRVDDATAQGLHDFLPGFNEGLREARISGRSIKHIQDSRPGIVREVLDRLERGVLSADEVLPNPQNKNRALLVLKDVGGAPTKARHQSTVIELSANGRGVDVVSVMTMPDRTLNKARALREEVEASRSEGLRSPHPPLNTNETDVLTRQQTNFPTVDRNASEASIAKPESEATAATDPLVDIDTSLPALIDSIISGERDVQIPTGAINEDGSAVTVSAREMLAEADGNIARAENDSKGFLAAALCALRFGN